MKRIAVLAPVAVVMVLLLAGCGAKEREELKAQVVTLQQQIEANNATLAQRDAEIAQLKTDLTAAQGERDQANDTLNRVGNELTAAKDEIAKLKAKATTSKTATKTTTKK